MLRCSGGSVRAFDDTSRSPTRISPMVGSRKPAINRSVVVLPHPEGPSRHTNCPWSIRSETLSTTASSPNRLVRSRNSTDANHFLPVLRAVVGPLFFAAHYKHQKARSEKPSAPFTRLHFGPTTGSP